LNEDVLYDTPRDGSGDVSSDDDGDRLSLPENTTLDSMPLWAIRQWFLLSFVSIPFLPRHFRRKFRERLDAAAALSSIESGGGRGEIFDLRVKGGRYYYSAGVDLVNLVRSQELAMRGRAEAARDNDLVHLRKEAAALKRTILQTYSGERLRRILDRSLGCNQQDTEAFAVRLTEDEKAVFFEGLSATGAYRRWKNNGMRPILNVFRRRDVSTTSAGDERPSEAEAEAADRGGATSEKELGSKRQKLI